MSVAAECHAKLTSAKSTSKHLGRTVSTIVARRGHRRSEASPHDLVEGDGPLPISSRNERNQSSLPVLRSTTVMGAMEKVIRGK